MEKRTLQKGEKYLFAVISLTQSAETFKRKANPMEAAGMANVQQVIMHCHALSLRCEEEGFQHNNLVVGQICTEEKRFDKFEPNDLVILMVKNISPKGTPTFEFVSLEEKGGAKKVKSQTTTNSPVNQPPAPKRIQDLTPEDAGRSIPMDFHEVNEMFNSFENDQTTFRQGLKAGRQTAVEDYAIRSAALNGAALFHQMRNSTVEEVIEDARKFETYLRTENNNNNATGK